MAPPPRRGGPLALLLLRDLLSQAREETTGRRGGVCYHEISGRWHFRETTTERLPTTGEQNRAA